MKKERNIALAVCAVFAALILLLTSQSSPLYPINLWGDANCLFTVGRVMKDGGVLYRDIYEQKGPLLYLSHALAACLSDTSFWGVYIMEALAMTVALYAAYRLMRLRAGMGFSLGAAAFFGAAFSGVRTGRHRLRLNVFCQGLHSSSSRCGDEWTAFAVSSPFSFVLSAAPSELCSGPAGNRARHWAILASTLSAWCRANASAVAGCLGAPNSGSP